MFDVCIIGSGPAGLAAAITAASKGAAVILLDKNKKAGKKLYATGNGKCNITNSFIDYKLHYHSTDKNYISFLTSVMGTTPYETMLRFLNSIGLLTYETNDGYVYPLSSQASSVVWSLLDTIKRYQVVCDYSSEVKAITKSGDSFVIDTQNGKITASQVIVACGGKSYPSLGGSADGYQFAAAMGHSIVPVRPALCGMYTKETLTNLNGLRVRAKATLLIDNQVIKEETGEIQFAEKALSGIAVFNLSSLAGAALQHKQSVKIELDFTNNMNHKQLEAFYDVAKERTIYGALNGIFHEKLCAYVLDKLGIDGKQLLKQITKEQYNAIVHTFSYVSYTICDLYDYNQAQVCAGGISLSEISDISCESKLVKNIFFVGEMLDIDGVCGGYNITFALLSGICAGEQIHVTNKSDKNTR